MTNFIEEISGKRVLVFGVGRQGGGKGDAEWLQRHGAIVRLSDKDLSLVPDGQTEEQIDWSEIIIKNPGVSDSHELIVYAKSKGIPVYTSIALFVKYGGIKTVGITGTRGKSTTVALITALLDSAFPGKVISGGNIAGTSCLALFDKVKDKDFAVLELSSFQLHNFHDLKVSPNISVITNLYPDHLNRYGSMADYEYDKKAICAYQSQDDLCLYNEDNPGAVAIAQISSGKKLGYTAKNVKDWETNLPGNHNLENIAAMAAVASVLKIDEDFSKKVVSEFVGLPFRQELIETIDGVRYVNDTTSTTPTAAIKALQASTTPIVWITGGDSKKLPYDELIEEVRRNSQLQKIIILGSKNIPEYVASLEGVAGQKIVGTTSSMDEALDLARSVSRPGDTILLSPGFSSFDLFQNEFDRGRKFNEVVNRYAKN